MRIEPIEAFKQASDVMEKEQRSFMVESDLCGSTMITWKEWRKGVGLQAAHERVCLNASSGLPVIQVLGRWCHDAIR